MSAACPYCGEHDAVAVTAIAALVAAIEADDLDTAIERGLLRFEPETATPCDRCRSAIDRVIAVRDARRTALAARERYRQRSARLEQRAQARAAKRLENAPTGGETATPGLPAAAAAALARAKAKAVGRK